MEFNWFWFTVVILIICVTVYSSLNSYWNINVGIRTKNANRDEKGCLGETANRDYFLV